MKITLTVCDVCQDKDAPVKAYEIKSEGRKVSVDLCAAHGEPLESFLTDSPKPTKKAAQKRTRSSGGGRSRAKVVTLDEIEKLKQG